MLLENACSEPIEFRYVQKNYIEWIKEFANATGQTVKNNAIYFQQAAGHGFSKSYFIEEGFTFGVQNYRLSNNTVFIREPAHKFGVIIYLFHFDVHQPLEFKINDLSVNVGVGQYYTLRVINAQTLHTLKLSKQTFVKGISIYLEEKWIKRNITSKVFEVFNYLEQANYFKEFINARQQKLMSEIVNVESDHPFRDVYVKSRVLRLVDKLFQSFTERDISEMPERLSEKDFETVQKIEYNLIHNYRESFPSIEKLAKLALMSESKLKRIFKQSFGMGMYEYFQKNRMHKAREMILTGKLSVTEAGIMLGYQNLSNFSVAFKKEFNSLPSEILSGGG